MGLQAKSQADSVSYPSLLLSYGIAVASAAVVLGLHLLLDSLFTHYSFLLLILGATMLSVPITLSAWYGGLGPGVLATLLSALISDYHFVYPIRSIAGLDVETIPLLAFFLEGIFVSLLAATLRFARGHAQESARENSSLYVEVGWEGSSGCGNIAVVTTSTSGMPVVASGARGK